ncbi:MAG TPA: hypothetical protein DEP84_05290 [Chloroflexi bacterium]|nr:hypothetical protein [Chloroflexota bacterium]
MVLERLTRCQVAVRYAIGVENIDVNVATDLGIVVAIITGYCVEAVADHCAGLLLTCARRLVEYGCSVHRGEWSYVTIRSIHRLRGQLVGFIGFGTIARRVAARLRGFGLLLEEALVCALQQGQTAGAALDLVAQEPPTADNPLLRCGSVIITPHTAAVSEESRQAARHCVCDAVMAVMSRQWLPFVIKHGITPRFPLAS